MQALPLLLEVAVVVNGPEVACLRREAPAEGKIDPEIDASISSGIELALSRLGDDAKQTLVFYMATKFDLNQDRFPANPEAFGRALARILGTGAEVIEKKILAEFNGYCRNPKQREFAESLILATKIELSIHSNQHKRTEDAGQS